MSTISHLQKLWTDLWIVISGRLSEIVSKVTLVGDFIHFKNLLMALLYTD